MHVPIKIRHGWFNNDFAADMVVFEKLVYLSFITLPDRIEQLSSASATFIMTSYPL